MGNLENVFLCKFMDMCVSDCLSVCLCVCVSMSLCVTCMGVYIVWVQWVYVDQRFTQVPYSVASLAYFWEVVSHWISEHGARWLASLWTWLSDWLNQLDNKLVAQLFQPLPELDYQCISGFHLGFRDLKQAGDRQFTHQDFFPAIEGFPSKGFYPSHLSPLLRSI